MTRLFAVLLIGIVSLLFSFKDAMACDPNEECSRCLIHNPFGGCVQYGNDPICEARKAACQVPGVGPLIATPLDPVTMADECLQNLFQCPQNVINQFPSRFARPIVNLYIAGLRSQADGRWQVLPEEFKAQFRGDYPQINLDQIRFAQNINTVHGQNMTLGNQIFLVGSINFYNWNDKRLLLHELYHSVQYALRGGEDAFLTEYALHAAGQIVQNHSFNIHDLIDLEADAIRKAQDEIQAYGWNFVVNNSCGKQVKFSIQYFVDNAWKLAGWWTFGSGAQNAIDDGGRYVHTNSSYYYLYAESTDGTLKWAGDQPMTFQGAEYLYRKIAFPGGQENLFVQFTCS